MNSIPPLRPRRSIDGISAVLLPFHADGRPDRDTWAALVERTWAAGLTPAVNMDTGYANLLTPTERAEFLAEASRLAHGRRFVAGAYIEGLTGDPASLYARRGRSHPLGRWNSHPLPLLRHPALGSGPDRRSLPGCGTGRASVSRF